MNRLLQISAIGLWTLAANGPGLGSAIGAEEPAAKPTPAPSAQTPPAAPAANADKPGLDLIPGDSPKVEPEPLPLIPELPEPTQKPKTSALEKPKKEDKNQTDKASEDMAERVRFRLARNKAVNDPAVMAQWTYAHKMRTDSERRQEMRKYYTMLFERIVKVDGSLKKQADVAQALAFNRLTQRRLEPSEELREENRTQVTE